MKSLEVININSNHKKTTDWNYDFPSLLKWNCHSIPFTFDLFVEMPNIDMLFCIYSVVEVSMGNYLGRLAVLQNKQNPSLVFCSSNDIYFRPLAFADYEDGFLFLVAHLYSEDKTKLKEPVVILDASKGTFAYVEIKQVGVFRQIIKKCNGVFELQHDDFATMRNGSKTPKTKEIHIGKLQWYPFPTLNDLTRVIFYKEEIK